MLTCPSWAISGQSLSRGKGSCTEAGRPRGDAGMPSAAAGLYLA